MSEIDSQCVICKMEGTLRKIYDAELTLCDVHYEECKLRMDIITDGFDEMKKKAREKSLIGYIEHQESMTHLLKIIDKEIEFEILDLLVFYLFKKANKSSSTVGVITNKELENVMICDCDSGCDFAECECKCHIEKMEE